jgi:hypothetical protein
MVSIFILFSPLSLVLNLLALPIIGGAPIWLRVLVTTAVATPLMTCFLLPVVTRALRPWLLRSR